MFWRRKKREEARAEVPLFLTKAAIWLNKQLIEWAASLQQWTMKCSPEKLKRLLALFCLLFIACSAYVIMSSLHEPHPFRIAPIQVVPLATRDFQQPVITESEYLRLRRLRSSLDSLAHTPSGKLRLDSILQKHPQLLNLLTLLEGIYYQHKKQ